MDEPITQLQATEPAANMIAVFSNNEILMCIAEQFRVIRYWFPEPIGKDIWTLLQVNKFFNCHYSQYFTDSAIAKNFIKKIAFMSGGLDADVARKFGNKIIHENIIRLFHKTMSEEELSKDDLKDTWYLNATGWCTCQNKRHSTLLLATLKTYNAQNAKRVIKAGININTVNNKNPIQFMTQIDYSKLERKDRKSFFAIARLLLAKGIHPDSRFRVTGPTLLHKAVENNNQHFAYSLLKAGANPYNLLVTPPFCVIEKIPIDTELREFNPKKPGVKNAFYMHGEHIDWLQKLVVKVEMEKKNPKPQPDKKRTKHKKSTKPKITH